MATGCASHYDTHLRIVKSYASELESSLERVKKCFHASPATMTKSAWPTTVLPLPMAATYLFCDAGEANAEVYEFFAEHSNVTADLLAYVALDVMIEELKGLLGIPSSDEDEPTQLEEPAAASSHSDRKRKF